MANQEHLDILKQGVDEWNRWRQKHPEILPDLREADLSEADLVETTMTQTTLTQCRIYGIAAWKVHLEGTIQKDLIITPKDECQKYHKFATSDT